MSCMRRSRGRAVEVPPDAAGPHEGEAVMDRLDIRESPPIREHYGLWRGVRITETTLIVGDRRYPIRELSRVRERRGGDPPLLKGALGGVVGGGGVEGRTPPRRRAPPVAPRPPH